jgi:hypothetical protein
VRNRPVISISSCNALCSRRALKMQTATVRLTPGNVKKNLYENRAGLDDLILMYVSTRAQLHHDG